MRTFSYQGKQYIMSYNKKKTQQNNYFSAIPLISFYVMNILHSGQGSQWKKQDLAKRMRKFGLSHILA